MKNKISKSLFYLSIICYFISLTQKAFCTKYSCADSSALLISGIFALIIDFKKYISWIANPLFFLSIFFHFIRTKHSLSLFISVISVCSSITFFSVDTIIIDEAGNSASIVEYKSGFWLWIFSLLLNFISELIVLPPIIITKPSKN